MFTRDDSIFAFIGTLAVFALAGLAVVSQLYLPIPIMQQLGDTYSAHNWPISWVLSAFGFAYATGFLIFGPLSDRLGRRHVLVWGMLGLASATYLVTIARDSQELILVRALQGFCAASFPPVALAYLSERLPSTRRLTAVSWMSFAFLSAAVLAQIFVLTIADSNFQKAEIITFGIYLAVLVTLFIIVKAPSQQNTALSGNIFDRLKRLPALFIHRNLVFYYVATFTLLLTFVCFYALIARATSGALSGLQISPMTLRLVALPGIAATFLAARLAAKYGVHNILACSFIAIFLGLLLSGASLLAESALMLMTGNITTAAGVALAVSLLITTIGNQAPPQDRGSAVAIYTFVLFCGASSAPLLASQLISFGLSSALFILAGLPLMAYAMLVLRARFTRGANEQLHQQHRQTSA